MSAPNVSQQISIGHLVGRRCFAMELDPVYCHFAVRRWEMATEKVATQPVTCDVSKGDAAVIAYNNANDRIRHFTAHSVLFLE